MENLELTDQSMDVFAKKVATQVVKMMRVDSCSSKMCTVKEAASILGIGEEHMRRIKDRFPHVKKGPKKAGRLFFERDALINEYNNVRE